ncbi:nuclear transport factor 2 family protein [Dactylosporangium sp. CA-092794]|uniref:nuclear transport factor 2 family protein n=1 Tax=Dactylosporangium sp. CA-092794 TaxID=3239929 RepID=UPI003D8B3504
MATPADTGAEAGLAELVQRLWDIEQIKQLKARYWRYIDEHNWSAFGTLFTADCHFRYGPRDQHFCTGGAEIAPFVKSWTDPGVTVHHGHTPEITILSTTTAEGIWALYDHVDAHGSRGRAKFEGYGHYHERYAKGDDGLWRISASRLTRLRVDQPGTA